MNFKYWIIMTILDEIILGCLLAELRNFLIEQDLVDQQLFKKIINVS